MYQGLVLIVVEVRLDQEYDIEPEGIAMLRENHLLRSHYHLPENFSIDRNLLENREDDDGIFYRYVTVYRLKDIQKLLQKDM